MRVNELLVKSTKIARLSLGGIIITTAVCCLIGQGAGVLKDIGLRLRIAIPLGACSAAETQKLFDVDVNKQKAALQKDFSQAEEFLGQSKVGSARGQAELLDHKLSHMKSDITKEEFAGFRAKIDTLNAHITVKEDSLVKSALDILHNQGVEVALQYVQNDLRLFGVSEKKANAVEKNILDEAPAVQQSLERKAIERTVKALKNNEVIDPNLDPYILKTAERIIKAHEDSIQAVENAKARKEMEEKQRIDRIQKEKEDKERKIEEEKAAKLKQGEEKKQLAEQEIARKKSEADEKEKLRLARIEEERQKKLMAEEEKARKDSIAAAQKVQAQQAKEEKQRQSKMSEQQREELRLARIEEDRQKQELAKSEKEKSDSLAAAQREEQQAKALASKQPEPQKKQEIAQREKPQPAAPLAQAAPTEQPTQPPQPKPRAVEQPKPAPTPPPQQAAAPKVITPPLQPVPAAMTQQATPPKPQPPNRQPALSKAVQEYLKGLRDNQKKAQEQVMELYDLVDKKQIKQALDKFKQNRAYIAQYVDAQVFNVLEQTIAQGAISALPQAGAETAAPKAAAPRVPEQESIDRINSFMRDNKVEAAYSEFKKMEGALKHYMAREDFKQLRNMVENAYKIRTQGK